MGIQHVRQRALAGLDDGVIVGDEVAHEVGDLAAQGVLVDLVARLHELELRSSNGVVDPRALIDDRDELKTADGQPVHREDREGEENHHPPAREPTVERCQPRARRRASACAGRVVVPRFGDFVGRHRADKLVGCTICGRSRGAPTITAVRALEPR